jgi:putative tricarboxylic transport membrane protein
MSEDINAPGEYMVSYRSVDAFVALLFMALSCVVMWDSWKVGAAWVSDGPQAGYFPFYIGLIMFIASLGTLVTAIITKTPNLKTFVGKSQLFSVLQVLIPTAIFVGLIPYLGIYVAGAIYIAFFMVWIGKYNILKAIPVGIAVPLALFILFEIWFLIPLPKGPVEAALGF